MSRVRGTVGSPPQGFGKVWEELDNVELTVAGDVLQANFKPRNYLRILVWLLAENTGLDMNAELILNNDEDDEYAYRRNQNGGADTTVTDSDHVEVDQGLPENQSFLAIDISDPVGEVKMGFTETMSISDNDPGTAPTRQIAHFAYFVTTARVTSIRFTQTIGGNSFDVGSRVLVLGTE